MRENKMCSNDIGLFFCWGVRFGLAEKNVMEDNRSYGISIGHRDTDNLIRGNTILRSGKVGVLFRPESGKPFAAHRNRLENNRLVDSGPASGIGIDVQGETEAVALIENELQESRGAASRIGIRIGAQTRDIRLNGNRIDGFAVPVSDLRKT
jgi:nitrous oxidase accessory protein NosD